MTRILNRPYLTGIFVLLALVVVGGETSAQQIPWYVVGSGATMTSGGSITLYGTIGQSAIGTVEGGSTTAHLGFWIPGINRTSDAPTEPVAGNATLRNYPNPFNTTTTIFYQVAERSQIRIRVYDLSGQLIKELVDEVREAGSNQVVWDGTDDNGREATSGSYVYKMDVQSTDGAANAKGGTQYGRMILVR